MASLDVASKRGVTCSGGVEVAGSVVNKQALLVHVASGSRVASEDVASERGVTCPGGIPGVTGRGIRTWHQNLASLAHVASESAGRGVRT